MALRPPSLPPVPEAAAAAVQAAFPKGNLDVALRAEFGALDAAQPFTDLYPPQGRPVALAPWRLALVMVRQVHRRAYRSPGGGGGPPLSGWDICPEPRVDRPGL